MRVLSSGASMRGLDPTSTTASASSMPASVVVRVYAARRSGERSVGGTVVVEPRPLKRSLRATRASTSTIGPAKTPISSPLTEATCSAAIAIASCHEMGVRAPSAPRSSGTSRRWRLRPSTAYRVLSEIHSSLMSSLVRGWMRITSPPRLSTLMEGQQPSSTSTDAVERYSHERVVKALGLEVRAPTGQRSTTLPDISELSAWPT
mmetsp:Transcript_31458/g.85996  ORF Transcript_31458/g.85996 Transcript_31458/m.85996 type:complete len:205 (-) Transcript_31458:723-1337(-)